MSSFIGIRCEIFSAYFYSDDELIETYPFLKDYDFEEITSTNDYGEEYTRAYIAISSLEDLFAILSKSKSLHSNWGLILNGSNGEYSIQIYDGCVE